MFSSHLLFDSLLLRSILTQNTLDDPDAFLQADLELHKRIAAAARNPMLSRFMDSISQLGLASRARTNWIPGLLQQSAEDHRAIVATLKARDPEAATEAMFQHLNNVEQKLRALVPEAEV